MKNKEGKTYEPFDCGVSEETLLGADNLIGNNIVNQANEELGEINDIMLYVQTGQIGYAIMSLVGIFGVGNKLFAVPWHTLRWDNINKKFILDISKERIKEAPSFDKLNWPDMADESWKERVEMFFNIEALVNTD